MRRRKVASGGTAASGYFLTWQFRVLIARKINLAELTATLITLGKRMEVRSARWVSHRFAESADIVYSFKQRGVLSSNAPKAARAQKNA